MAKEKTNTWKKAAVPYFDLKIGGHCIGILEEVKIVGERTNSKTGEVTPREMLFLRDPDNTENLFQVNCTAGLKNALANSFASKGDLIKIDRLEKKDIGKGQTVNQYDIFIAQ